MVQLFKHLLRLPIQLTLFHNSHVSLLPKEQIQPLIQLILPTGTLTSPNTLFQFFHHFEHHLGRAFA
jgi:hypothetical protein